MEVEVGQRETQIHIEAWNLGFRLILEDNWGLQDESQFSSHSLHILQLAIFSVVLLHLL